LLGDAADDSTVRSLRTTEYPFVLLEKTIKTLRLNTVMTDTAAGSFLIVNHIDKLGYKNVIITADRKFSRCNTTAIQDVLNAIGKRPDINRPVIVEVDKPSAGDEIDYSQFEKFLRPPYRADVMIIMNASLVYPIMALLRKKKLRVPQDIAVLAMEEGTGFDLMFSPVTCLRRPLAGMSTKVANMIWSEVKNSGKGKFKRQVFIAPELIVRNSCGTI
jgi:DNA-binding LacI/PurR family transcriptional regulator